MAGDYRQTAVAVRLKEYDPALRTSRIEKLEEWGSE
jgi:hypothetical protein